MACSIALPAAADPESVYGADAYATCSACHLADGVGVPGAFPPIRNRTAAIAQLDGGRDYLITVVSYGLMGNIDVAGAQFFGVMAGNAGALSAADIAAALNYVIFELNDAEAIDTDPFTAEEVEKSQANVAMKSPAAGGELRVKLVESSGDQWP
jgi:mono/diheme cytochrome c family protein